MPTIPPPDEPGTATPANKSPRAAWDIITATLVNAGVRPVDARRLACDVLADLFRADWLVIEPYAVQVLAKCGVGA